MYTDKNVPPLPAHITFEQAKGVATAILHRDPDAGAVVGQSARADGGPVLRPIPQRRRRCLTEGRVTSLDITTYTVPAPEPGVRRHPRLGLRPRSWSSRCTAGDVTGLGYTYAAACGCVRGDRDTLAGVVPAPTPMATGRIWPAMVMPIRNLGRPGIASCAISAVDIALWDLKARLLGVSLADAARARARRRSPSTAAAASPASPIAELAEQLGGLGGAGIAGGEDEGRARPGRRPGPGASARDAIGDDAELFVDANGAYTRKQALALADAVRRARRHLVRGAGQLGRPRRAAPAPRPRRRRAWTSPPASTATTCRTSGACSTPAQSTASRPT